MFFGLTFEKLIVIVLIVGLILGPERLPALTQALARAIRRGRDFAMVATSRVREEIGPEFDEVDWRQLDPRKYDPRRIFREALFDTPALPPRTRAESPDVNAGAPESASNPGAEDTSTSRGKE